MFEFSSKEENINKKMTLKLSQLKTKKIIDLVRKLNLDETFTFELREFFKDETLLVDISNKPIEEIKKSKINVDAKLLSIQKRINASLEESFLKKYILINQLKLQLNLKMKLKSQSNLNMINNLIKSF